MDKEKKLVDELLSQQKSYAFYVVRPSTIQRDEAVRFIFSKVIGSGYLSLPLFTNNVSFYGKRKKMEDFNTNYSKKLLDPIFSNKHFSQYQKDSKNFINIASLAIDLRPLAQDLLKIFQKWNNILSQYAFYFYIPFAIEARLEPQLREFLLKKYPQNFEEIFNIIASPTQVFDYQYYQKELLMGDSNTNLSRLINKYAWVKEYSFKEELLNEDLIKSDLAKIKSEKLQQSILNIEETVRHNKLAYSNFIKTLDKNSDLFNLVDLVHRYVDIRTERIEVYKKAQAQFRNFYKVLSKWAKANGYDLDYYDVISLTNREIVDLLHRQFNLSRADIDCRKCGQYLTWGKIITDKPYFIYDKKLIALVRRSFATVKEQKFFKGIPASAGKVQGLVKIITGQKDFNNFKKDEILVTYFTTPDFVPLIKMAKAIITDDGGITCHAGIVARELKKPCIVGTKIATQVLKDGDMVEVDANLGIVRKLK